ncbi:UPF0643 protein PB2B2.08 isoform X1 [Selaginella moellendorffii]|nr:UPF0643 protein PB2B2.08 isoform X1 [Selaginella moellendorffii]|eukprot:XP_002961694.2 UPF0643 protein PB2B2.08 isoform X1 [Selaginella moellendorffii]
MPEESDQMLTVLFRDLNPTPSAHSNPLTAPLLECFDFSAICKFPLEKSIKFYLVAFRSVRKATADDTLLYKLDAAAQAEALESGGLLRYWYGRLNAQKECLAMCVWSSRDAAIRAGTLPAHIQAASVAHRMYDAYTLERYWLELSPSGSPDRRLTVTLNMISQTKP